jgi:hypothetical protein
VVRRYVALSARGRGPQNAGVKLPVCAALALAACSSVSEVSEGLVLTVHAEAATGRAADGSLTVLTDLGYTVRLERAYLVSSSVEIFPCPRVSLSRWLIGRAEAHAPGSPTRLGTAVVEPLTGPGDALPLGDIRPPPDRYCRVVYTASAADHDAVGLPSDLEVAGRTVVLAGTFRRGAAEPRPFTVASSAPIIVEAPLADADLFAQARQATLVVRKQADHWFDGVDFETHPPRVIAAEVLESMRKSIRLEWP